MWFRCLQVQNAAAQAGLLVPAAIALGELEAGVVAVEAGPVPPEGPVAGGDGPDEGGQQVHGAVEAVEDRPRDLAGEHGEDVIDLERDLESEGRVAEEP